MLSADLPAAGVLDHARDHVVGALTRQALGREALPGIAGDRHRPGAVRLALGGLPEGAEREAAQRLVGPVARADAAHRHRPAARICASGSASRRRQFAAPSMQQAGPQFPLPTWRALRSQCTWLSGAVAAHHRHLAEDRLMIMRTARRPVP